MTNNFIIIRYAIKMLRIYSSCMHSFHLFIRVIFGYCTAGPAPMQQWQQTWGKGREFPIHIVAHTLELNLSIQKYIRTAMACIKPLLYSNRSPCRLHRAEISKGIKMNWNSTYRSLDFGVNFSLLEEGDATHLGRKKQIFSICMHYIQRAWHQSWRHNRFHVDVRFCQ